MSAPGSAVHGPRRLLVAVSVSALDPPRRGNQIRTSQLLGHLGPDWDVESYSLMIQRTDLPIPRSTHAVSERWTDTRSLNPAMVAWTAAITRLGYPPVYASTLMKAWPHGALRRALSRASVAWVCTPYASGWVRKHSPGRLPVVLDVHSIEADMYPPRKAAWTRLIGREVEREERNAIRDADLVFVTCDADKAAVAHTGAGTVKVIPNGVDIDRFVPRQVDMVVARQALGLPTAATIGVFVGSGHPPNLEAVAHLERQAAAYKQAGITVAVVGRCSGGRQPVDNVMYIGEVTDVVPYLQAADVALCPLVSGSGTSLKTIEYLAAGLPLVTTSVGVRGLGLEPGIDAEVCDLEKMPGRAGAVAADGRRRQELAHNARRAAERFSWEKIGAQATDALDGLVATRSRVAEG